MKFEVITTSDFEKSYKRLAKKHRSLREDVKQFISDMETNPFVGDELYPGIRKIRMAIESKGKGKSGGARIITFTSVVNEETGEVYLMEMYDKSDFVTVNIEIIKKHINQLGFFI